MTDAKELAARLKLRARFYEDRASAGTCPCCQERFAELETHMQAAHPDFKGRVRKPDLKVVGE